MELKNYFAQDLQGNIIAGASCYMYQQGTQIPAVGVVDINGEALANPFLTDTDGLVRFAAPNGLYDLRVTSGARDYTLTIQFLDVSSTIARFISPKETDPTLRDNGAPLQLGDTYLNIGDMPNQVRQYGTAGWFTPVVDGPMLQGQIDELETDTLALEDFVAKLRNNADSTQGASQVAGAGAVVNASQQPGIKDALPGADLTAALQAACNLADLRRRPFIVDLPFDVTLTAPLVTSQLFDGQGCKFIGTVVVRARKHAKVTDFTCSNLLTEGVWHSRISNINVVDAWTLGGYDPQWGTFYNTFRDIRAARIILDVSVQAINGNGFQSCIGSNQAGQWGLLITDFGATTGTGVKEAHANTFYNCDFSHSLGASNNIAVRNQTNYLIGCYFEHGAKPYGNFTIGGAGLALDGNFLPAVSPFDHVMNMANIAAATFGDSLSLGARNMAVGGDFNCLLASGKPPCFAASFAATMANATNPPYGYNKMYGGVAAGVDQNINVSFKTPTGKFSAWVWLYSGYAVLPDNLYVTDNLLPPSYRDPAVAFNAGGGWYLYRICGEVTPNAAAYLVFVLNGSGGGSKEIYIGGVNVSPNKAVQPPMFVEPVAAETVFAGGREFKAGIAVRGYVEGGTSVDVTVAYGTPFRLLGVPSISLEFLANPEQRGNYVRHEILTNTSTGFSVRLYYTTNWAGVLNWSAASAGG